MKFLTLVILLILIAAAIVVMAWIIAEFKARRFNNECIYLDMLINQSDVTGKAYDDINRCLNELDCYCVRDEKRKRLLWATFQFKFKSISPYRVNE